MGGRESMNPRNVDHNPNLHSDFQTNMLVFVAARRRSAICSQRCAGNKLILNLAFANYSPVRIPSALLENSVGGRLKSGRKASRWTKGRSRSVKVSQSDVRFGQRLKATG
jgi:hypothetical protein